MSVVHSHFLTHQLLSVLVIMLISCSHQLFIRQLLGTHQAVSRRWLNCVNYGSELLFKCVNSSVSYSVGPKM